MDKDGWYDKFELISLFVLLVKGSNILKSEILFDLYQTNDQISKARFKRMLKMLFHIAIYKTPLLKHRGYSN
jgi:hypothetical protein